MKIKTFLSGIILCIVLTFSSSCFKKDTEIDFSVKNPAKGYVNGHEWVVKSGIILKTELFGEISYDLVLIDTIDDNLCDMDYAKVRRLHLELPTIGKGKYSFEQVKMDEDYYGLSFTDNDTKKSIFEQEVVAYDGNIEIMEVDRIEGVLTGYIEAIYNEKNLVKGDFKVRFCVNNGF